VSVTVANVGSTITALAAAPTLSVTAPAGSGGILICCVAVNAANFFNEPFGWRQEYALFAAPGPSIEVYSRVSDGSADDTPAFTLSSGSGDKKGLSVRLAGARKPSPFDPASNVANAYGTPVTSATIPGFTPARDGGYQIVLFAWSAPLTSATIPGPLAALGGNSSPFHFAVYGAARTGATVAPMGYTWTPSMTHAVFSGLVLPDPTPVPQAAMSFARQRVN